MRKLFSTTTLLVAFVVAAMAAPRPTNRQLIEIYIAQHKDLAIFEHLIFGIPTSITLAQALLESENGNSMLAREGNNHFGIKCPKGYDCGKVIMLYDDDTDKRNRRIRSAFQTFSSVPEGYRAHSLFLKGERYQKLFKYARTDYANWAKGLQECGYATNPAYARTLIGLIRQYNLDQYDLPEVLEFSLADEALEVPTTEGGTDSQETIIESSHASFEAESPDLKAHSVAQMPAKKPTNTKVEEKITYTLYEFVGEPTTKSIEKSKPKSKTRRRWFRP
jgi:Mannosyl-glycoprotein endo-beta-N-acetylglucosaminidase